MSRSRWGSDQPGAAGPGTAPPVGQPAPPLPATTAPPGHNGWAWRAVPDELEQPYGDEVEQPELSERGEPERSEEVVEVGGALPSEAGPAVSEPRLAWLRQISFRSRVTVLVGGRRGRRRGHGRPGVLRGRQRPAGTASKQQPANRGRPGTRTRARTASLPYGIFYDIETHTGDQVQVIENGSPISFQSQNGVPTPSRTAFFKITNAAKRTYNTGQAPTRPNRYRHQRPALPGGHHPGERGPVRRPDRLPAHQCGQHPRLSPADAHPGRSGRGGPGRHGSGGRSGGPACARSRT